MFRIVLILFHKDTTISENFYYLSSRKLFLCNNIINYRSKSQDTSKLPQPLRPRKNLTMMSSQLRRPMLSQNNQLLEVDTQQLKLQLSQMVDTAPTKR